MIILIEANGEEGKNDGLGLHIWRGLQIWRETLRIAEDLERQLKSDSFKRKFFKFFAWSGSRPSGDKIRPSRSDQGEERP
jgi:hypothetical protein